MKKASHRYNQMGKKPMVLSGQAEFPKKKFGSARKVKKLRGY